MTDIRGIWAAAISVIDKTSLKLDVESTINHAESIIDSGAHGCVMGGSTSQSKLVDLNSKYNRDILFLQIDNLYLLQYILKMNQNSNYSLIK